MITASLSSTGGHGPGLSSIGRVLAGEGVTHTTHASSSQGALRVQIGAKTYSGDDCDQGDVGHGCVFGWYAGLSLNYRIHEKGGESMPKFCPNKNIMVYS